MSQLQKAAKLVSFLQGSLSFSPHRREDLQLNSWPLGQAPLDHLGLVRETLGGPVS